MLGDLSIPGLEQTRELILEIYPDIKLEICEVDVSNEAAVEDFFQRGVQKFGRIDFAANVAGYAHKAAKTHELAESEYIKSYAVNQKGVIAK